MLVGQFCYIRQLLPYVKTCNWIISYSCIITFEIVSLRGSPLSSSLNSPFTVSAMQRVSIMQWQLKIWKNTCTRLESLFLELVGSMKKTLGDSFKDQIQELVRQNFDDVCGNSSGVNSRGENHHSSYCCGTRLARINFPPFPG